MNLNERLIDLLNEAKALFLDFDGPVCDIFSGLPAPVVAERLKSLLVAAGAQLPPEVAELDDPLKVLRRTPDFAPDLLDVVERAFMAHELEASESARITPGVDQVIKESVDSGRPVVIVSNNSEPAIKAVCERAGFADKLSGIVGRPIGYPGLMKPHPRPIFAACGIVGVDPSETVLIGDSDFDMRSAADAGAPSVGLAHSPQKAEALKSTGAAELIGDMNELARSLTQVSDW
ncbi:HAD family hydrolase [Acrocarpospora macrocephala]|uniref:Hydrolase n=1 Tax=Acrocarpospora macrocephala TaxID=150177 RepID=A0A5M3WI00_9ACTN|nr:HAD family hydrolase [Acrocarpospora macrocephala]GES07950.1 hydrolase [Acrocarpospora macrocephala]